MCHITGSGLLNFLRLSKYGFEINEPLDIPLIFTWLQEKGNVAEAEMFRTFNMGMGYAYIMPEKSVPVVKQIIPDAKVIGKCVEQPGVWIRGNPDSL
jgi:phosphoribosylformylglycinamidine cyclo-ligase